MVVPWYWGFSGVMEAFSLFSESGPQAMNLKIAF
jgi:hypothetical protein